MKMKSKKAQMKLSFGMIFSIILIIFFLVFAFWGIRSLLETKEEVQINQFADKLNDHVDEIWRSTSGYREYSYNLPDKVDKICFFNDESKDNLKIIQKKDDRDIVIGRYKIKHINIEKTTGSGNEKCIENKDKEINLILKKQQALVIINEKKI